jgi:hypothetical protein
MRKKNQKNCKAICSKKVIHSLPFAKMQTIFYHKNRSGLEKGKGNRTKENSIGFKKAKNKKEIHLFCALAPPSPKFLKKIYYQHKTILLRVVFFLFPGFIFMAF